MAQQTKTPKKYYSIYAPIQLMQDIKALSIKEGRSFNSQVIFLLKKAMES